MIKKIAATAALLFVVVIGIWAVSRSDTPVQNPERLQVTASYYPLYEFAKQVGGNHVQVVNMTPAGTEPHDFEPSAKDLADADQAKVFIYNGGSFEPWTDKFAQNYKGTTVRASQGIALKQGEDDHGQTDPHFWLDPVLARQIITNIRDGLTKADPAHASDYAGNAAAYNRQLIQLDQEFAAGLQRCQQRTIVVSHQSMSYLAALGSLSGLRPATASTARL